MYNQLIFNSVLLLWWWYSSQLLLFVMSETTFYHKNQSQSLFIHLFQMRNDVSNYINQYFINLFDSISHFSYYFMTYFKQKYFEIDAIFDFLLIFGLKIYKRLNIDELSGSRNEFKSYQLLTNNQLWNCFIRPHMVRTLIMQYLCVRKRWTNM